MAISIAHKRSRHQLHGWLLHPCVVRHEKAWFTCQYLPAHPCMPMHEKAYFTCQYLPAHACAGMKRHMVILSTQSSTIRVNPTQKNNTSASLRSLALWPSSKKMKSHGSRPSSSSRSSSAGSRPTGEGVRERSRCVEEVAKQGLHLQGGEQ